VPGIAYVILVSMRVIAGSLRRRTLKAPGGLVTRPTSDRLRETLFNVLAPRIEGAYFLDLYAGSGAVGIEALSRGAAHVTFVERGVSTLQVLRANLQRLDVTESFRVEPVSVTAFLRRARPAGMRGFDLVFLDPPYDAGEEYWSALGQLGAAGALLAKEALVVAEHRRKEPLQADYGELARTRLLQQGDSALSFYCRRAGPPSE
jgi:16S rRNA (guanine(966)-N(2))-methyltransferase RsmD